MQHSFGVTLVELQWGRVRVNAEGSYWPITSIPSSAASMGPRSCERGRESQNVIAAAVHEASMGPRSCERGRATLLSKWAIAPRRFNGAAFV